MHWFSFRLVASWLTIGLGSFGISTACGQEVRTWKDTTGNFSVKAVLTVQDATSIGLKTEDGRVLTVPKGKLSQSDLDYLKSQGATAAKPTAQAAESTLTARLDGPPLEIDQEVSLSDFLRQLGLPVFVDRVSLSQVGIDPSIVLSQESKSDSLAAQLDAMLSPTKLTWHRLRTVLVLTTKKSSEKNALEALAYRIPIPRNDASAVLKQLQSVQPQSWEAMGGRGSAVPMPGVFVILQTGDVHRQLARQLRVRSLPHRYVHPLDNAIVSVRLVNGSLAEFARQLETQLKQSVVVSESGDALPTLTVDLANVSAADALQLALGQIDYQWLEDANRLEIVPDAYARQRIEQRRVTIAFASPQLSSLVQNAIMTLVEPRSWAHLGGPGQIRHAGGKSFEVSQTQPTFRKLFQLVADLGGQG